MSSPDKSLSTVNEEEVQNDTQDTLIVDSSDDEYCECLDFYCEHVLPQVRWKLDFTDLAATIISHGLGCKVMEAENLLKSLTEYMRFKNPEDIYVEEKKKKLYEEYSEVLEFLSVDKDKMDGILEKIHHNLTIRGDKNNLLREAYEAKKERKRYWTELFERVAKRTKIEEDTDVEIVDDEKTDVEKTE